MQLIHEMPVISGRKGGSASARQPKESPDDLLSVGKLKMLLAISNGEIKGDLTAQEIYLNDTPLANNDGSYNFSGVKWEWRPGTQDQTYIQGLPESDQEMGVGVKVTQQVAWTRQITDLMLDAVRIKLSLPAQYSYKDNGDMIGTTTRYAIDLSTDGSSWQTVVNGAFSGKTTTEYQRDHRIDLPRATTGWSVRVRRITGDSTSAKLVNAFQVFSYADVVDSKLRYPLTALLYIEVDASQFSGNTPKITCKPKGRIIQVPSNYNPETREYSGVWDGEFVLAYTNNPVWVFYDLVLNKIYGMGTRVDASMIDKWELYTIAQYCDEMVSDGAGGKEPRFTCNVYIQSQNDAYDVLKDIAAIFRGITFWGNSQIFVKADVPQLDENGNVDTIFNYHNSNVIDGLFSYAGGSYKNRYTQCMVSFSDPQNHYADDVETVFDYDLQQRYGIQKTQLTAIGCTSRSEANRRGRWTLLSNAKDGTVSFNVGLDGHIPLPASIVGVADQDKAGKQNGGRLIAVDGRTLTLDRPVDYAAGDRIQVNLPTGKTQTRTISAISDNKFTVTVATAFTTQPVAGAVWSMTSDSLAIQYFRVTSVAKNDDGTFNIAGVQFDPGKFRYIDDGVRVQAPPITVTPVKVMPAPANILITEEDHIEQGLTVASMIVAWDRVDGATTYEAQWRKDVGDWINVSATGTPGFSVQGIYSGVYDVRVRAVNAAGITSPWGSADATALTGKIGAPGDVQSLLASTGVPWYVNVTWGFPDGSGDTAYTEIQVATTADGANPLLLANVAYPGVSYQHGPMPGGTRRWYRARLVDKIGNAGAWSDFVAGATNADASDLIGDITGDFLTAEDGKELIAQVQTNPEALLQELLAGFDTVEQQWANYGKNRAGILQAQNIAADAEKSVAKLRTDVVAQFDDQEAAISEKMTAYADADGASSIYTLKTGIKYNGTNYDAGISVAVTINGEQVDTRFAVNANQFVVLSGSGENISSPFIVKDGQAFFNDAFFAKASIGRLQLQDVIESDNYVENKSGIQLNFATGLFKMFGSVDGEGKSKWTNNTLSMQSSDGELIQIGYLTGDFDS